MTGGASVGIAVGGIAVGGCVGGTVLVGIRVKVGSGVIVGNVWNVGTIGVMPGSVVGCSKGKVAVAPD